MYLGGLVGIARRQGFRRDLLAPLWLCLGWISTAVCINLLEVFSESVTELGLRVTLGGYDGGFKAGVG